MASTNTIIENRLIDFINHVDQSNYEDILKVYNETEYYPENEPSHPYHDMVENIRQAIADKIDTLTDIMSPSQKEELSLKIYNKSPDLRERLKTELPDIQEKHLKMKDFYDACKNKTGFYEDHSNQGTLGIVALMGGIYDSGVPYITLLQRDDGMYGVYRDGNCVYTDIKGSETVPSDVYEAVAQWEALEIKPTKSPVEVAMDQEIEEMMETSSESYQKNDSVEVKEQDSELDNSEIDSEELSDDNTDDWEL